MKVKSAALPLIFILRFFSNQFENGMGFLIEYSKTIDAPQMTYRRGTCGGNFTTKQGLFTSPSYPGNYLDNEDCTYTILQPNGIVIQLKFLSMDIEYYGRWGQNCYNDYLEIRDGPLANSPLLEKLCGSEVPASIQSSQNQLWMK